MPESPQVRELDHHSPGGGGTEETHLLGDEKAHVGCGGTLASPARATKHALKCRTLPHQGGLSPTRQVMECHPTGSKLPLL